MGKIIKEATIGSQEYYDLIMKQVVKGLTLIKKNGIIPFKYKSMGVSPRILPVGYSNTVNSVRREVRHYAYEILANQARLTGIDISILYLDLKSCYTSILLGLYPQHLSFIQGVLEGKGLWNYIKQEFKNIGKGSSYNKPAVKICTYASFFQGGYNAMIQGIIESHRNNLGLTVHQFKKCSFFEELHAQAMEIASIMMNSMIVNDFKSVSSRVLEEFLNEYMVGPSGHSYLVNRDGFKTIYPNYLQSFEFAILAQSTLMALEDFNTSGLELEGITEVTGA